MNEGTFILFYYIECIIYNGTLNKKGRTQKQLMGEKASPCRAGGRYITWTPVLYAANSNSFLLFLPFLFNNYYYPTILFFKKNKN